MKAFAINCTLKPSPSDSSVALLLSHLFAELEPAGVSCEQVRAADYDIKPGVESDMGPGDDWPALRARILDADIFVLGTPIWLGHPSSFALRVLERLDAFLGETDDQGRKPAHGKVACLAICGNEDGAHHTSSVLGRGLSDVGFTLPTAWTTYWVGEALGSIDYKDHDEPPEQTAGMTRALARNAVHLAKLLGAAEFPAQPG